MAKILGKMHKSKVLGADTHSVSLRQCMYAGLGIPDSDVTLWTKKTGLLVQFCIETFEGKAFPDPPQW